MPFHWIAAGWLGPAECIHAAFAKELTEDPGAPFIRFLLYLAGSTTTGTIAAIGWILFFPNTITFLLTFKKLDWFFHGFIYKFKNNKSQRRET